MTSTQETLRLTPVAGDPQTVDPASGRQFTSPSNHRSARPRIQLVVHSSEPNKFRVSKSYLLPSGVAKATHDPESVSDWAANADESRLTIARAATEQYGPFTTRAAFDLAEWYWKSTQKSFSDFEKLISIFHNPDFSISNVVSVNWGAAFRVLGANRDDLSEQEGHWIQDDGWKTTPVSINVPFHKKQKNSGAEVYLAGNFRHRSILSVIKEKIANVKDSQHFHYQPYTATWKPNTSSPAVELYGELYSSRAFREVNEQIQSLPSTDLNDGLERVVVSLMFWSDATMLTSFGGSTLWPCYLFFGNESKYRRSQPSELLGRQVAYFIKLPDAFKEYLKERNGGKVPTDALFSHCARELFQAQWCVLLDEELIDAMKNGIVLRCPDGKMRCFYPRVFTYSADYPEKILIGGIRNNGGCPCHRCTIKKDALSNLGAPTDTERRDQLRSRQEQTEKVAKAREIIASGLAVDTDRVEDILKPRSLVPTVSALDSKLSQLNFELLPALVVDLLHEFEIGVWKNLFIHLVRLLDAFTRRDGPTLTAELDARYRATPAFGRDTIRKFGVNASEMKQKAARDYEDLLQCAIPAFEGLLPEPHNSNLMRLLYICAQWHALAKLRIHHDITLDLLDYTTVRLGAQMRLFDQDTCERTATRELQKEADARARREGGKGKGRKPKKLAVFTIKFHVLGDYSTVIRRYGTTDSYSTETGELCHRMPKSWFERTDKRDYQVQLSEIERRQARLMLIRSTLEGNTPSSTKSLPTVDNIVRPPGSRYTIGVTRKSPVDLLCFAQYPGTSYPDPYLQDFIPKLKQHLLPRLLRLLGYTSAAGIEQCEWANIAFQDNRMFSHKLMRIDYTTYDARLEQDVIHIDTPQCNAMLLSADGLRRSDHPYAYERVIGIFHANVSYIGPLPDGSLCYTPQRIDFCWVHRYDFHKAMEEFALERVSPCPLDSPRALGFLDPAEILRAAHLVPQFSLKRMIEGVPAPSKWDSKKELWNTYFINRFADRDLFMRYQYGLSIGHTYMYSTKNFPALAPIPTIPTGFDYRTAHPSDTHPSSLPNGPSIPSLPSSSTSQQAGIGVPEPAPQAGATEVWPVGLLGEVSEERENEDLCGEGGEIANSYDDELDDEELLCHDEMYGTQMHS